MKTFKKSTLYAYFIEEEIQSNIVYLPKVIQ